MTTGWYPIRFILFFKIWTRWKCHPIIILQMWTGWHPIRFTFWKKYKPDDTQSHFGHFNMNILGNKLFYFGHFNMDILGIKFFLRRCRKKVRGWTKNSSSSCPSPYKPYNQTPSVPNNRNSIPLFSYKPYKLHTQTSSSCRTHIHAQLSNKYTGSTSNIMSKKSIVSSGNGKFVDWLNINCIMNKGLTIMIWFGN